MIGPLNLAAIAGCVWLDSGVARDPSENDLAMVAEWFNPACDSLAVVRACVPIAEAVVWVLACRRNNPPEKARRLVMIRGGKNAR